MSREYFFPVFVKIPASDAVASVFILQQGDNSVIVENFDSGTMFHFVNHEVRDHPSGGIPPGVENSFLVMSSF